MKKGFSLQRDKKVVAKDKNVSRLVDIEKITHLTCESYITTVHIINNEDITVSRLLKYFEIELAEYGFLRANRNTIVNAKNVSGFRNGSEGYIVLVNGEKIKISRRKMHVFKSYFSN